MRVLFVVGLSAVLGLLQACGGDVFSNQAGAGGTDAGSLGAPESGGRGASGATGGTSGGRGGTPSGTGGVAGGSAGDAGIDASVRDSSTDAGVDSGPTPIVVIQASETGQSMSPSVPTTIGFSAPPTPGNSIIVGITCQSSYGVILNDAGGPVANGECLLSNGSVTDDHGNVYTRAVQGSPIRSSQEAARGYVFIAQNIVAGSPFVIRVDPDGTPSTQTVVGGAIEVSGLLAPPSSDATGYSAAGADTFTTAATFQPTTQGNELAVAVLSMRHGDVFMNIVHESTWTSHHLHQDGLNGPPGHSMVSKVLTASGIASHRWTHTQPSRGAAGIIVTFKGY